MPQLALVFPRASDLLCKSLLTRFNRVAVSVLLSPRVIRDVKTQIIMLKNFNKVVLKVNYFIYRKTINVGGFKGGVYGLCL